MNHEVQSTLVPGLRLRIARCREVIAALRVRRWCWEWPPTHRDAPPRPEFVRAFETAHGPAPESAQRILDSFQPMPA